MTNNSEDKHIQPTDLIPYIVKVLKRHGRSVAKKLVQEEIYKELEDKFKQDWYQRPSGGTLKWIHLIAWARDKAGKQGLIKTPADSKWGTWELTEKGQKAKFDT
jgi:hypothetical protein